MSALSRIPVRIPGFRFGSITNSPAPTVYTHGFRAKAPQIKRTTITQQPAKQHYRTPILSTTGPKTSRKPPFLQLKTLKLGPRLVPPTSVPLRSCLKRTKTSPCTKKTVKFVGPSKLISQAEVHYYDVETPLEPTGRFSNFPHHPGVKTFRTSHGKHYMYKSNGIYDPPQRRGPDSPPLCPYCRYNFQQGGFPCRSTSLPDLFLTLSHRILGYAISRDSWMIRCEEHQDED
ncbi:hypothetical protein BGZ60DRAFT_104030 [Tricladium varicosporioides]|nr:hypothetical protein BGZ60DRAFT_104030 [Hymenoscyphus varicosporioides]